MAISYDAKATVDSLINTVAKRIGVIFPIEGRQHTLEVQDVQASGDWDMKDIDGYMRAKLHGRTWGLPITGTLVVRDKATGKVLDRKQNARLMTLPVMTRHFSYIVDGKEFDATRQWRLKAGVYHRVKANGQLEAQWNLSEGRGFHTAFDPARHKFTMQYASSTVSLYPVLRALGTSDAEISRAWGPDLLEGNVGSPATSARDLTKLYKAITGKPPADEKEMLLTIRDTFAKTAMRPDVNKITLGRPDDRVTPGGLLQSSKRLLDMSRGKGEPDARDSVVFKELLDIDDFVDDRLVAMTRKIQGKVRNRLDHENKVDAIYSADYMNHPVKTFFTGMSLAEQPRQVNPVDMFSSMTKTTVMGEGGIQSSHGVPLEARILDNSHVGVLDPIHSPEGGKVGINLHLALGAGKQGREPTLYVRDPATGKIETKTVQDLEPLTLAFPDQFIRRPDGKMQPVAKMVTALGPGNEIVRVPASKVDFVLPTPKAMFSITGNLVPFLQNTSGPRVSYAMHHMEQALALKYREQPLIAVASGGERAPTFEDLVGRYFTSRAPVDGRVVRVAKDHISIRGTDGKLYKEPLYVDYPLNEKSAFINSEPVVKAGDKVEKGQVVADTNHTRDGQLALGVNLKTAYMPYLSNTYDDAIVISESASQKLTSQHLYKERLDVDEDITVDKAKYRAMYRDRLDDRQAKQLDNEGVVQEGTVVQPGDVLVTALRKRSPTEEELLVRGIAKSLARPFADVAVRWESQYPGVVKRVVKNGDNIQVHVASEEPAGVGDKLCFDPETEYLVEGKGWVKSPLLTPDDRVLTYKAPENPSHRRSTADGWLEWQYPTRVVEFDHDGQMYRVLTAEIDQFVTPNHNLYVKVLTRDHQTLRQNRFRLVQARKVLGKPVVHAQYGANENVHEPASLEFGKRTVPTRSYLKLLAHLFRHGIRRDQLVFFPGNGYSASCRQAMDECGITYSIRTVDSRGGLLTSDPLVCDVDFENSLPAFLDTLPTRTLSAFLHDLFRGTPMLSTQRHGAGCTRIVNRSMIDRLQELGVRARVVFCVSPGPGDKYTASITVLGSRAAVGSPVNFERRGKNDGLVQYTGKVYCCTVPNGILVTRRNFKVVLSGNSGRHGNKGVISTVLPDDQMPRTKDGPVDIILNPLGIPSRINVGTVLETSLSKVAKKEGRQIAVSNFEPDPSKRIVRKTIHVAPHSRTIQTKEGPKTVQVEGYSYERDYTEAVEAELAKAEISEKEEVTDPVSGKSVGNVLVGYQYTIKHVHQAEKKLAARSGGPGYDYDANMAPKSSGHASGQSMGELGLYSLLSHGALSLIREGTTYKSDASQSEVWTALQTGEPLPPPKPSFAYGKFLSLLSAMGVAVDRTGSQLSLRPTTDEDVLKRSNGELKESTLTLRAKDLKPEEGGLFDERITGGIRGDRWCFAHDTLVLTEWGPMRIGTLVEHRIQVRVWSYDFQAKEFVLRPITEWHRNETDPSVEPVGTLVYHTPYGVLEALHGTFKHELMTEDGGRRPMGESEALLYVDQDA